MSIKDLYGHSEYKSNLAHFAALATLAASDGVISDEEQKLLDKFVQKLNISEADYEEVMKPTNKYPIEPPVSSELRLERLYDLFKIIFVDHMIDDEEMALLKKYAIGLGFSTEMANSIIQRSVAIFSGKIDYEDYLYLLKR
jgi:uncharacterized tellurite resistance protein B-like protein